MIVYCHYYMPLLIYQQYKSSLNMIKGLLAGTVNIPVKQTRIDGKQ